MLLFVLLPLNYLSQKILKNFRPSGFKNQNFQNLRYSHRTSRFLDFGAFQI